MPEDPSADLTGEQRALLRKMEIDLQDYQRRAAESQKRDLASDTRRAGTIRPVASAEATDEGRRKFNKWGAILLASAFGSGVGAVFTGAAGTAIGTPFGNAIDRITGWGPPKKAISRTEGVARMFAEGINNVSSLGEFYRSFMASGADAEASIARRLLIFARGEWPEDDIAAFWHSHFEGADDSIALYEKILSSREYMRVGQVQESMDAIRSITKPNLSALTQELNLISSSATSLADIKADPAAVMGSLRKVADHLHYDIASLSDEDVVSEIRERGSLFLITFTHACVLRALLHDTPLADLCIDMTSRIVAIVNALPQEVSIGKEAWNATLYLSFFINQSGGLDQGRHATDAVCGANDRFHACPKIMEELVRARTSHDIQYMFATFQRIENYIAARKIDRARKLFKGVAVFNRHFAQHPMWAKEQGSLSTLLLHANPQEIIKEFNPHGAQLIYITPHHEMIKAGRRL